MACEFVCDGCGRRAVGQLVGQSSYGTVYTCPQNWKKAIHGSTELHACCPACAVKAERVKGIVVAERVPA